jgi:hypothetical protein
MRRRFFAILFLIGMITMGHEGNASPLDEFHWQKRVLVVVAPPGDVAAAAQRQIFEASAEGMSERAIVLLEARDDSERSRQLRARLSADSRRFQVFLVGKDGHTAVSWLRPLSAAELFARVDAMPMRRDEMRRGR